MKKPCFFIFYYLLMNSFVDLEALPQIHMNSLVNLLFPFPLQGIQRISHTVQRRSCRDAAALRVGRPRRGAASPALRLRAPQG